MGTLHDVIVVFQISRLYSALVLRTDECTRHSLNCVARKLQTDLAKYWAEISKHSTLERKIQLSVNILDFSFLIQSRDLMHFVLVFMEIKRVRKLKVSLRKITGDD